MVKNEARRRTIFGLTALALGSVAFWGCAEKAHAQPKEPLVSSHAHHGLPQNSRLSQELSPNMLPASAALALVRAERDQYWLNAKHEVYKSTLELIAQHQTELARGIRYDKILRGDPRRREIALTIDDGPHPLYTPKLLQILKQNGVHATFFVVGEQAERYPDLIRAEVAAGNEVGNHTYDHVSLVKIPPEYIDIEITACGDVIKRITGKTPHLFRPPGGEYNKEVAESVEALGYKLVLYSDDPGDYAQPGTKLIETRTLNTIGNGGIILLHDGSAQTLTILPQIIQRLKSRGFQFVTVDQMLQSNR